MGKGIKFDDSVGKIEIIEYNKNRAIERIWTYETSWWRKLLFIIGINCYYKEKEYVFDRSNLDNIRKYSLTPNECIETKPESNE